MRYAIQENDRLSDVAIRHGVSVYSILVANPDRRRARTLGGAPCFHEEAWAAGEVIEIPRTLGGTGDPPNSNGATCPPDLPWDGQECSDGQSYGQDPTCPGSATWVAGSKSCSVPFPGYSPLPKGASCHSGTTYDSKQGLCVGGGGTSTPACDAGSWDALSKTCVILGASQAQSPQEPAPIGKGGLFFKGGEAAKGIAAAAKAKADAIDKAKAAAAAAKAKSDALAKAKADAAAAKAKADALAKAKAAAATDTGTGDAAKKSSLGPVIAGVAIAAVATGLVYAALHTK